MPDRKPRHHWPVLSITLLLTGCGTPQSAALSDPMEDVGALQSEDTAPNPAPGAQPFPALTARHIQDAWSARPTDYVPRTKHLEAEGSPRYTNRLFLETSPYLRQHAHNPVNWYPWGDEAFEAARQLGRPVLLSVGYSTCHWCHVMEEESFEDTEIARYLNENYVAIKVDREERPDVDAIYMAAVHAISGRGGWPMTVWLNADRQPYFAGTYFPARDGDRGVRSGFLTVIQEMKRIYTEEPGRMTEVTSGLTAHLQSSLAPDRSGPLPGTDALARVTTHFKSRYDPALGGISGAPKFPSSLPIRFLLQEHRRTGDAELLTMATHTLRMMAAGGMYDQIGGGFHRYSTDKQWLVPHFEKMLYDNALLTMAYLEAWQITGEASFERIAREILRSIERDMTAPEGAFYSATDADSPVPGTGEREEGWFFTWTPEEVRATLDAEHAEAVIAWFAIEARGNFEGRSIPHRPREATEVAEGLGISPAHLDTLITEARETMYLARAKRPPPIRDEKILTAWNGLMISAYAQAGLILREPAYTQTAARAADFVLSHMRVDGRLRRSYTANPSSAGTGEARHAAVIEDYAFLVAGLIDLFEATGEVRWLTEAISLDAVVAKHYEDATKGGWYRTPDDGEVLLAREKPDYDGAEPTGASAHVRSLYRLGELTTEDRYRARADKALEAYSQPVGVGAMTEMLLAVDWRVDTPKEVVIVTPTARQEADPFLQILATDGPRNRVLVVASEAATNTVAEVVPLIGGKTALGGKTTAYVCEQGLCDFPTTDPQDFQRQLSSAPVKQGGGG